MVCMEGWCVRKVTEMNKCTVTMLPDTDECGKGELCHSEPTQDRDQRSSLVLPCLFRVD